MKEVTSNLEKNLNIPKTVSSKNINCVITADKCSLLNLRFKDLIKKLYKNQLAEYSWSANKFLNQNSTSTVKLIKIDKTVLAGNVESWYEDTLKLFFTTNVAGTNYQNFFPNTFPST